MYIYNVLSASKADLHEILGKLLNIRIYPILCHRRFLELIQLQQFWKPFELYQFEVPSVAQNGIYSDIYSSSGISKVSLLVVATVHT